MTTLNSLFNFEKKTACPFCQRKIDVGLYIYIYICIEMYEISI